MLIRKGYKVEIEPNNKQRTLFLKNAGAARFAYNWGLHQKEEARQNGLKTPTSIDLNKKLNKLKKIEILWAYEVSKCSFQEGLRNLDRAFENFFRKCELRKQGKLKGKVGYPKFKSKKNGIGSFTLRGSLHIFQSYIQLPRIGRVKLKECGYLPLDIKISSVTVSEHAGKWFVSLQIEREIDIVAKDKCEIGVDLGISRLAISSKNELFSNPKVLRNNLDKIKILNRWVSRKQKNSQNREKAIQKLSKQHCRIMNIRKDVLHKITTYLTKTKSKIVIEDLNVSGMMSNHKLALAIQDTGFCEFRRQLEYKGKWYNCEIILANRWFPSSKMCSKCKNIKDDLKLSNRIYICDICGLEIDRDLNAAINLEYYGTDSSSGTGMQVPNAFGVESSGLSIRTNETIFVELGTK